MFGQSFEIRLLPKDSIIMYTLFNSDQLLRQTNTTVFGLDYVKRELMGTQVERYKQYRAMNPGYLKSDHVLLKILGLIDIPFDGDLPDYYLQVSSIVNRLAGQMGFCNAAHHGRVSTKSQFYGKGVNEIIIAVTDDNLTPAQIWFGWRDMSPIRVLSHPVMGCGILELNGTAEFKGLPDGAMSVLELNIPLLACQYHLWRMAVRTMAPEGHTLPAAHFITQVIIPNMLSSHLDVAVLNTMHHLLGAEQYTKIDSAMPFFTTDLWPRLTKGLGEIVNKFSSQTSFYKDILSNTPVFGQDNLLQTVRMPDIAYTNQAIWALTIARLPVIAMLLKFDAVSSNAKNDSDKNRIRRSLKEAQSGKYLVNQLPANVADYVAGFIAEHIEPYL